MSRTLRLTSEQYERFVREKNRAGEMLSPPRKRGSKFGNQKTGEFDSKKEAGRAADLALLQKSGAIRDLRHHVPYAFVHNGILIGQYIADHVYFDVEASALVVEDTKSPATRKQDYYRMKVRAMLAFHGINVREV